MVEEVKKDIALRGEEIVEEEREKYLNSKHVLMLLEDMRRRERERLHDEVTAEVAAGE